MIDFYKCVMAYHNLVMYYRDREYWVDKIDKDFYSYLKIIDDLYKLIGKKRCESYYLM